MMKKTWVLALAFVVVAGCAKTAENTGAVAPSTSGASGNVTFASNVQPIIKQRCAKCHVDKRKGHLSLATLASTLEGGEHKPDVVPGDSAKSLLYKMVSGKAKKRMPPKGDPLTAEQIATIKSWIDGGAH